MQPERYPWIRRWSRPQGRPRKKWIDIREDCLRLDMTRIDAARFAEDRNQWRNGCVQLELLARGDPVFVTKAFSQSKSVTNDVTRAVTQVTGQLIDGPRVTKYDPLSALLLLICCRMSWRVYQHVYNSWDLSYVQLENVAIANALQLEAAPRRASGALIRTPCQV